MSTILCHQLDHFEGSKLLRCQCHHITLIGGISLLNILSISLALLHNKVFAFLYLLYPFVAVTFFLYIDLIFWKTTIA